MYILVALQELWFDVDGHILGYIIEFRPEENPLPVARAALDVEGDVPLDGLRVCC